MDCTAQRLTYRETGAFSKIVLDYLDQHDQLKPFFEYAPDAAGIAAAINARAGYTTNRQVLVQHLQQQYQQLPDAAPVTANIHRLLDNNTFTVTTAHQPNLFTGPLYFLYKIIHAIRLSETLNQQHPEHHFVPVYYMGSEDADVEELAHYQLHGEKRSWNTDQSGAFGRFVIDRQLIKLIDDLQGELGVLPFGHELIAMLRRCYTVGATIQQATLQLVHELFGAYGLVVLNADSPLLKQQLVPVLKEELLQHNSSRLVQETTAQLERYYKVQAGGRQINLFYLDEDIRERIELVEDGYAVANTTLRFSQEELLSIAVQHPDRFSPNVILRGLYQEMILPNIAFIGGGGELAYWLELKAVFNWYKVPYPVLVLRNSFLLLDEKWQQQMNRMGLTVVEMFQPVNTLLNNLVRNEVGEQVSLQAALQETNALYAKLQQLAGTVDPTLIPHVAALQTKAVYRIEELEKKMFRAAKRKFETEHRQLSQLKTQLFPGGGLQERTDNFSWYYARWGTQFISCLYQQSLSLEQAFVVLQTKV